MSDKARERQASLLCWGCRLDTCFHQLRWSCRIYTCLFADYGLGWSTAAPSHSEACFCFELRLKLGAHTLKGSAPWSGFGPEFLGSGAILPSHQNHWVVIAGMMRFWWQIKGTIPSAVRVFYWWKEAFLLIVSIVTDYRYKTWRRSRSHHTQTKDHGCVSDAFPSWVSNSYIKFNILLFS